MIESAFPRLTLELISRLYRWNNWLWATKRRLYQPRASVLVYSHAFDCEGELGPSVKIDVAEDVGWFVAATTVAIAITVDDPRYHSSR